MTNRIDPALVQSAVESLDLVEDSESFSVNNRLASSRKHSEFVLDGLKEISDYLGKSTPTIAKWIKHFHFPAMLSPTGRWFTTKSLVNSWIVAVGREDAHRSSSKFSDLDALPSEIRRREKHRSWDSRHDADKNNALMSVLTDNPVYGKRVMLNRRIEYAKV